MRRMPWGWEGCRSLTWGSLSWIANHSTEMLFTHIQKPTHSSNMLEKPCLCMQQNCLKFIFARKERQHPLRPRDAGDSKVPHPTCPQPGNRNRSGLATGEPYLHPHMHSGCQAVPETQGHCLKPERHVPSPRLLGFSPRDHSLDQCLQ